MALVAAQGNQPQYVAFYARALLEQKEFDEAASWIDRLEELAPRSDSALKFRAEVQFRRGNANDAIATLVKFIEKAAAPADRLSRTLGAAAELEALASLPGDASDTTGSESVRKKAEELYREYVKEDPKHSLVLVNFLGRRQRFDEALKLLAEAATNADAPPIAASCELLFRQSGILPEQVEQTSEILNAALKNTTGLFRF